MVLVEERQLELRELPVPDAAPPGGALLAVEACGMCGSDHEFFTGGAVRAGYGAFPMVIGHEPVGRIEAIDPDAARRWGVAAGDRVAIEAYVPCGSCEACRAGTHRRCRDRFSYASVPVSVGSGLWGGFAEVMELRPNTIVHRLPDQLTPEDAVLFNPVGAGFDWTARVGGVGPGDRVIVLGTGQRGLACVAAASFVGAAEIVATSRRDGRELALAKAMGATATVAVGGLEDGGLGAVRAAMSGPADVVIDLVPRNTTTVQMASALVRPGGRVVLAGIKGPGRRGELVIDDVVLREVQLVGVLGVSSWAFREAIRLVASNRFPFSAMHTATIGLEDVTQAILAIGGETTGERPLHITVTPHSSSEPGGRQARDHIPHSERAASTSDPHTT
jgi:threonine dehydrogenase-like Zn-dependent dehydrogenase